MSINKQPLTIGLLAKAARVNIETVRHYQRQGLVIEPIKPDSGFRHYPFATINRIRFIKRAQHLGFSLKEIGQLLALGNYHCNDIQTLAASKRDQIEKQIQGLLTIQSVLDELINACNSDKTEDHCALIDALSQKGFLDD